MNIPEEGKQKLSSHLVKHLEEGIRSEEQTITVLIEREDVVGTADALDKEVENKEATIVDRFDSINTDVVQVKAKELNDIIKNPAVKSVAIEQKYHLLLDVATKVVNDEPATDTNISLDGSGVTIAIVDSGIHPHEDLISPKNRIIAFYDAFQDKEVEPSDDGGHGTHCAGCAAGNGMSSNKKYRGLAHNANLVGVKVFQGRSTLTTTIMKGVQWCIDNREKYGINVMSLSLGGTANASAENDPLCRMLRQAQKEGIVVLAAAGNTGRRGPKTIESPGIEPEIITVGATNDFNTVEKDNDIVVDFSSRGPTKDGVTKPDVVAPGTSIVSLRSPGSDYDREEPMRRVGENYCWMDGTSMATPIVAGLAALLIQAKPDAKPAEIKRAIEEGAIDIFQSPNDAGKGYVNLKKALEKLNF
ncbi:S8 family peptidase [Bacillus atrophaeus]|uniref:S8 family peptidase n=1 Tax=Bacillus atrophaeus TaxID=1452 RepID=UPI00227E9336|nr:S8 family peptidase [Bacillus atrophaeus]MCY8916785.1 S8 family peptidase [Bacillus atrophaeus]MCY8925588.1 S8 family peptidase [Bacillus atrophaeus]